jgi:hypothetical protein
LTEASAAKTYFNAEPAFRLFCLSPSESNVLSTLALTLFEPPRSLFATELPSSKLFLEGDVGSLFSPFCTETLATFLEDRSLPVSYGLPSESLEFAFSCLGTCADTSRLTRANPG